MTRLGKVGLSERVFACNNDVPLPVSAEVQLVVANCVVWLSANLTPRIAVVRIAAGAVSGCAELLVRLRRDDSVSAATVIRNADALLPGVPTDGQDQRWKAIIAVGEYIESEPEAVWQFICRWGSHLKKGLPVPSRPAYWNTCWNTILSGTSRRWSTSP